MIPLEASSMVSTHDPDRKGSMCPAKEELETRSDSPSASQSNIEEFMGFESAGLIGTDEGYETNTCPCCSKFVVDRDRKINTFASAGDICPPSCTSKEIPPTEKDDDDDKLFGTLEEGENYKVHKILAQGWLHKKGTGFDLFLSRAWKQRWARLVLAKVPGYEVDVPLLLIYWYSSSTVPSTVLSLASTVVISMERKKREGTGIEKEGEVHSNHHYFDIVHARPRQESDAFKDQETVTRSFSAPLKERDEWVRVISQALLKFEKTKAASTRSKKEDHHRWKKFASLVDESGESSSGNLASPRRHSPRRNLPLPRCPKPTVQ